MEYTFITNNQNLLKKTTDVKEYHPWKYENH